MPATAERLSKLVADSFDLDHEPRFDTAFRDLDINSMDAVRFFKLVNDEFDLGLAPQDCLQFKNLNDLESFIDARAG